MKMRLLLLTSCGVIVIGAVLFAQTAPQGDYQSQSAALKADDAAGRFKLAEAVYRKGLYQETIAEADKMLSLDNGDLRAKYLKAAAGYYLQGGGVVMPAPVTETTAESSVATTTSVAATTTETSATPPSPPPAPMPPSGPLTKDQAEALYKKYGKSMTDFQTSIQTALINSCGNESCHGNAAKGGRFVLKTQKLNERTTVAENFQTVDALINHDNLANSQLLTMALAGKDHHPSSRAPIFNSENNPTFKKIRDWVLAMPGTGDLLWK